MPSRRRLLQACVTGFAATAGCVTVGNPTPTDTTPRTDTPVDDDPSETGTSSRDATPADGELNDTEDPPERVGTERIQWETDAAYTADNPPTLADGRLVAGTTRGLSALSPATGDVQWSAETDWPVQTPRLVGGTLVTVTGRYGDSSAVRGLDPATGERRWTFEPGGHRLRVLASEGDTLFVVTAPLADSGASGSDTETLYALASSDGSIRWEADVPGGQDALVVDGTVYVADTAGVVAVETGGSRVWTRDVDTYQSETLVHAGNTLAFVSEPERRQPRVHGVDAATGEEQWTVGGWRAFTTRAHDGRLFVGGERLARLDPSSGERLWTVDTPVARLLPGYDDNRWVDEWRTALGDAPVIDGTLYVGGPDAAGVAVDDGTVEWRHDSGLSLVSPVATVNGNLLLHGSVDADDRGRHLVSLDATAGEERWTFAGRFRLTEPAVDAERAYLAESRNGLFALGV
jgi:outer membrane protein assembly factor BamB